MNKSNRFTSSNSGNRSNSRFSVLNDLVESKANSPKEPISNSLFSNRTNNNSRFASLKEEPLIESTSDNSSNRSISGNDRSISDNRSNRSYSSFKTTMSAKKPEPVIQQLNLKESDFPDLISISAVKKEEPANKWAAIVKKEVAVEVKETDEDKLPYVEPGWICIRKNPKTGKSETIQGPLTEEQRQYDRLRYLEQYDFKYNMLKTIERMSARWDEYKEQFDERYGPGAYNEKYDIHPSDDDNDDDYDDESDSDSEYEYVYE